MIADQMVGAASDVLVGAMCAAREGVSRPPTWPRLWDRVCNIIDNLSQDQITKALGVVLRGQ